MDEPPLQGGHSRSDTWSTSTASASGWSVPGPRAGREARLVSWFPACQAVGYGHTHVLHVERFEGVWILNPGSPTERRSAPARSMLELEIAHGELHPTPITLGA